MPPRLERVLIDPEGERSPPDQGVVVLAPVADAIGGLGQGWTSGHGRCRTSGRARVGPIIPVYQGSRSYQPFVQQRLCYLYEQPLPRALKQRLKQATARQI